MREIKFRYWTGSKVLNQEAIINRLNKYIARNDEHLMQFTGLLDKQGVEIYEGDIVEYNSFISEIKWSKSTGYKIVDRVTCRHMKRKGCSMLGARNHNCEVIGNIYENPELLKDK